jgi:hypothetical protein
MSLADLLANRSRPTGTTCWVQLARLELSGDDRATFEEALEDPTVTAVLLSESLAALNVDLGPHSISRHRRGLCKCAK